MHKIQMPMLCGILAMLGMSGVSGQVNQPQAVRPEVAQSSFDTVEAPVLKVYSAEDGGHRFVAYLVNWNDAEVVVSDPLARSHFQEGDTISFMVQKVSLTGSPLSVSSLNFHLLDGVPSMSDETRGEGEAISAADRTRLMNVVQGDLSSAESETERFYALNQAAKKALRKGETEKARELATELEGLAPKYQNDWNYGNAVQDANQVLGLIALRTGDVVEARRRLLASADSKGSPQMNSFGPNMQLAKAMLEMGEREVVLDYFNRCGAFWTMGGERLAAWTDSVKQGQMPEFGANLNY